MMSAFSSEPEPRCAKCSAIQWHDEFTELRWMQCSREDCDKCYPEGKEESTYGFKNGKYSFEHYESFVQLEESAENGCQFCRVLFMTLVYRYRNVKTWTTGALRVDLLQGTFNTMTFEYSPRWPPIIALSPIAKLSLSSEFPRKSDVVISEDLRLRSQDIDVGEPLPIGPEGHSSIVNGAIESELEKINKHVIQPWLSRCQQHHPECKSPPQHAFLNYPTRLVWVGDTTNDVVKLVETGGQCPPYLILSYCWGKTNDTAKTTEKNYRERTKRIQTSALPKTIRDAIHLTRAMGEKYIWIDAMCIKQSDKGHTGDWATEASKVGDYYANAKCLISAVSAAESEEGFLGERSAWRYPQRYSLLTHGRTLCKDERISFYVQGPEQQFWCDTASGEPLTERGWCLQEWLLCPRRLHWTRNGLHWECNTVYSSESDALFGKSLPGGGIPMMESRTSRILQQDKEEALGRNWLELVEGYSRRKLTMKSDRLFAIHGIATRLARQHDDIYCAGIFGSQLVYGLMWHCDVTKRESSHSPGPSESFPSWSWASAFGKVSWPWVETSSGYSGISLVDLIRFPHCHSDPDFTELRSRELLIRAPLARIFLHGYRKTSGAILQCGISKIEIPGSVRVWEGIGPGHFKFIGLLFNDDTDEAPGPDAVLLAAVLVQHSEEVEGIILNKVTVDNKEMYMREYIFSIWDKNARHKEFNHLKLPDLRPWQSELTLV